MFLSKMAAGNTTSAEQAKLEPYRAANAAKYEKSFFEVLTSKIDLASDRTYLASETQELSNNKPGTLSLSNFKFEVKSNLENLNKNPLLISGNDFSLNEESAESYKPLTNNNADASSVNETESCEKNESNDGREEELEEIEEKARELEKYLTEAFQGKLEVKIIPKNSTDKNNEGLTLKLKDSNNETALKKFFSKVEAILKKQFPKINLSNFNIEMAKLNVGPQEIASPDLTTSLTSKSASAMKTSAIFSSENSIKASAGGTKLKKDSSGSENKSFGAQITGDQSKNLAALKTENAGNVKKLDQLLVIEQVKNHLNDSKLNSQTGSYSLKMVLKPEALGSINLEMVLKDGQLSAKFNAENASTVEILMASAEQLKEMLGEKGIKVANIEFSQQAYNFDSSSQERSGGRHERGNSGSRNDSANDDSQTSEISLMAESRDINGNVYVLSDKTVNVRI